MGNIKKKKILIVCTGNSCRSPMAEGFLKKYLKPQDAFEVTSAGISSIEGLGPSPRALEAMQEEDIDISSHRSKPFSKDLAETADLILAMANIHKDFILESVPQAKDKVCLYKEFAGINDNNPDIEDPIGSPLSVYKRVKEDIKKAAIEIARRLKGGLN